ncbi:MAG: GNAT family N-acetyltransferase [Actinobacteria bacterium]|nr:GNAT family N-acetyltransferase [Actinomycetota bacterium]MCA1720283.1 GNAT family N-acetyltransferase [Actinomycetota bacterium]
MELRPVRDLPDLTTWHAVVEATFAADHAGLPADPLDEFRPLLEAHPLDDGEQKILLLGCAGADVVGAVRLGLPMKDNLTSCSVDVRVHPERRRQGHGRSLLALALQQVEALGRTRVFGEVPSPLAGGPGAAEPMLREVGARPVLREVRRLLDLQAVPPGDAPAAPAGYRLVQWVHRVPDEHLEDMAYLMHRMSTDVPLGDMDWEPEVWDAQRYRDKEAAAGAAGRVRYATLAVSETTGKAAGFTDIGVSRYRPDVAYQWETIVDREHRGHGLGYVLKAHNHRLLVDSSPDTRLINTWNAETNVHMIAVNDRLGFDPVELWTEWQLDR